MQVTTGKRMLKFNLDFRFMEIRPETAIDSTDRQKQKQFKRFLMEITFIC